VDPYEVLGVSRDATSEEIRRAYVVLARRHHPDYHADAPPEVVAEAGRRMQAVNEAWAVLGDPVRRRRLDGGDRPDPGFRPFHPVDDDEPDPRDAPDVPYRPTRPPTPVERAFVLGPVGLFVISAAAGSVGLVMGAVPLLVLSVVCFVLSCVGFLVVPLLALGRASRDEG
jgi:hypothetical protein